ncbi:uncharacterized protein [Henckelia pumila]|uniref:uncharacterized protein n=1 Tax=Henckelia pumila TaxID=405737 RepID=UPI003C6E1180
MHRGCCQLAYAAPTDSLDEYVRMGEITALDCLVNFCQCVIDVFGVRYLRRPNDADTQRLLQMHEDKHDFPRIRIYRLVDMTCFFGVVGSRNDINVLNESPLFNAVLQGNAPNVHFTVKGTNYTKGYYLTDGIYPEWAAFVKSFPCPEDPKRKKFKERQESARKDVERAFGVLQARWAIIRGPARSYYKNNLWNIMNTCIILHNKIIEDEGDEYVNWSDEDTPPPAQIVVGSTQ